MGIQGSPAEKPAKNSKSVKFQVCITDKRKFVLLFMALFVIIDCGLMLVLMQVTFLGFPIIKE